jgi:hypothetical protein
MSAAGGRVTKATTKASERDAKRKQDELITLINIYTQAVVSLARRHHRPPRGKTWTFFALDELAAALRRSLAADAQKGRRRGRKANAA